MDRGGKNGKGYDAKFVETAGKSRRLREKRVKGEGKVKKIVPCIE